MTDELRAEMNLIRDLTAIKNAFIEGNIQYTPTWASDSYRVWASRIIDNATEHIARLRTDYGEAVLFCENIDKKSKKERD